MVLTNGLFFKALGRSSLQSSACDKPTAIRSESQKKINFQSHLCRIIQPFPLDPESKQHRQGVELTPNRDAQKDQKFKFLFEHQRLAYSANNQQLHASSKFFKIQTLRNARRLQGQSFKKKNLKHTHTASTSKCANQPKL